MLKEFEKTKRGPGKYEPSHKLVEARQDVGVQQFREPFYDVPKFYTEGQVDLYPNFNYNKPNKLVFKYYKSAEVGPRNMPDSEANPGKWVFYDVDLDAVRAELAQNIYFGAKNESPEEFKDREEFQQMLEAHIKRINNRRPEHGDYETEKPVEIEGNVNFDKMIGREDKVEDED